MRRKYSCEVSNTQFLSKCTKVFLSEESEVKVNVEALTTRLGRDVTSLLMKVHTGSK